MLRCGSAIGLTAVMIALSGCSGGDKTPTINASMTAIMEPNAEKIWDIVSGAYNEIGDGLVPGKISNADWEKIGEASRTLKARAEILATAPYIRVADANEPILGSQAVGEKGKFGAAWEAVDAKAVQAKIDADPAGFKAKARVLVDAADAMNRASQTRDLALLYKVSSGLDEVCDGCHEPFWGTDEPPPVPKTASAAVAR